MKDNISLFFDEVKDEIKEYFKINSEKILSSSLGKDIKSDNSIVTEADIAISKIIEKKRDKYLDQTCFYSEEKFNKLTYPALIVDPIDGTIEFSKSIGECCVSIAYMQTQKINDPKNRAWLFNPFTGFEINSEDFFIDGDRNYFESDFSCQVSRTEWNKGLYKNINLDKIKLIPRGSIAFKLGNLAAGSCDLVYSHNPKSIWDIAAGSVICAKRNINIFINGKKSEEFKGSQIEGKIIWAHDKLQAKLVQEFEAIKRL